MLLVYDKWQHRQNLLVPKCVLQSIKLYLCSRGKGKFNFLSFRSTCLLQQSLELISMVVKLCKKCCDEGNSGNPHKFCFNL